MRDVCGRRTGSRDPGAIPESSVEGHATGERGRAGRHVRRAEGGGRGCSAARPRRRRIRPERTRPPDDPRTPRGRPSRAGPATCGAAPPRVRASDGSGQGRDGLGVPHDTKMGSVHPTDVELVDPRAPELRRVTGEVLSVTAREEHDWPFENSRLPARHRLGADRLPIANRSPLERSRRFTARSEVPHESAESERQLGPRLRPAVRARSGAGGARSAGRSQARRRGTASGAGRR